MQGIKRKVTVGGKKDANPLPPNEENIRARQQNFSHYCVVCHGLDGQNTGVPSGICRRKAVWGNR
jgi:mono/diheme cytochrome c family protein